MRKSRRRDGACGPGGGGRNGVMGGPVMIEAREEWRSAREGPVAKRGTPWGGVRREGEGAAEPNAHVCMGDHTCI